MFQVFFNIIWKFWFTILMAVATIGEFSKGNIGNGCLTLALLFCDLSVKYYETKSNLLQEQVEIWQAHGVLLDDDESWDPEAYDEVVFSTPNIGLCIDSFQGDVFKAYSPNSTSPVTEGSWSDWVDFAARILAHKATLVVAPHLHISDREAAMLDPQFKLDYLNYSQIDELFLNDINEKELREAGFSEHNK